MTGMSYLLIGVDPGYTTGIHASDSETDLTIPMQIDGITVVPVLQALRHGLGDYDRIVIACEQFVIRNRASKISTPGFVREQVGQIGSWARGYSNVQVVLRPAVTVKAWATDARLVSAGWYTALPGMRHAMDAARHALYARSADLGVLDPILNN